MGYWTYFSLNYEGPEEDIKAMQEAASKLEDEDGDEAWKGGIRELIEEEYLEAKWYGFQEEFCAWASQFPTILFIVKGDGEERDDLWELRVKGNDAECRYMHYSPLTNKNLLLEEEKTDI